MGRDNCLKCFRIRNLCLCSTVSPFEIEPLIVLLVHPQEFMKTVGTVRLVKLSVKDSVLMRGTGPSFDRDEQLLTLLTRDDLYPVILFPGAGSTNLSAMSAAGLGDKFPPGKRLAVVVIDGTWTSAKQIIRQSKILSALPKISFDVHTPSTYQFRKQPEKFCLSTVEAVSLLVENLKIKGLCAPVPSDGHLKMLLGFQKLVETQLGWENKTVDG